MSYKKMGILTLSLVLVFLIGVSAVTVIFDPYFHYHAPFSWQNYTLDNERYQNDGITRHFEYNAIITGTSMTENFKTSECDALFGVQTIKIPYFGASFKEINDSIVRALERNTKVEMVIRCLDTYRFLEAKDEMKYSEYPEYLYDDNIFNDVKYLLNKDILVSYVYPSVVGSLKGIKPNSFDDYANWHKDAVYGKDAVLSNYTRLEKAQTEQDLSESERETVIGTVKQNLISVAKANPEVTFYYFLPPYSIVYWDSLYVQGALNKNIEAQRIAIELLLECENIKVFSFVDEFEKVCDLNNYKDNVHYREEINSYILECMKNGEHLVTKENCEEYFAGVEKFYCEYSYDSIFE